MLGPAHGSEGISVSVMVAEGKGPVGLVGDCCFGKPLKLSPKARARPERRAQYSRYSRGDWRAV